jgi:hypothetical protein
MPPQILTVVLTLTCAHMLNANARHYGGRFTTSEEEDTMGDLALAVLFLGIGFAHLIFWMSGS